MRRLFHRRIGPALAEGSSWAAIAATLGTTGTQLGAPWSTPAFLAAAVAGIIAVLLRDRGHS
jgi:hypothetical protein